MDWGGLSLSVETGKLARQADGAVLVTYGDTVVLGAVVFEKEASGTDFLPLSVHYQEKAFAAGKIPGGFFKREGRPSEEEVLISRLIDRPLRPLFPKDFRNEVQVLTTLLSLGKGDKDIAAMIAASASLSITGLPFGGPVACTRVTMDKEGSLALAGDRSSLDLVVAGTQDSILMVESQAKELSEEQMLEAVLFGHNKMQPVIELIEKLVDKTGKRPFDMETGTPGLQQDRSWIGKYDVVNHVKPLLEIAGREERKDKLNQIKDDLIKRLDEDLAEDSALKWSTKGADVEERSTEARNRKKELLDDISEQYYSALRQKILSEGVRPDHRELDQIRPIECEVGILPATHGSSLFTRGETQALAVTTLGTGEDGQMIDALEGNYKENFMLHYNFPGYSVGEINNRMGVGRREIGHGKLAWRALRAVLPESSFPYTIRLVSEILESNGSSSMATVCASSMALMEAGVPVEGAVAGIAMGLVKEGDEFAILSDIAGEEDHCGDMDFKVAGTSKGITALQMDIKVDGISKEIMEKALSQAKVGRVHILECMSHVISSPRDSLKDTAPQMVTIQVQKDKIREVIGAGGKVIRDICETTGAKVDISDDGLCNVSSCSKEGLEAALKRIKEIVDEPEVGEVYKGTVVKVMDFGAFVNFFGQKDGLVHISQITESRVERVEDFLNEGKPVYVKLVGFERGKPKLSMKGINQKNGTEIN